MIIFLFTIKRKDLLKILPWSFYKCPPSLGSRRWGLVRPISCSLLLVSSIPGPDLLHPRPLEPNLRPLLEDARNGEGEIIAKHCSNFNIHQPSKAISGLFKHHYHHCRNELLELKLTVQAAGGKLSLANQSLHTVDCSDVKDCDQGKKPAHFAISFLRSY